MARAYLIVALLVATRAGTALAGADCTIPGVIRVEQFAGVDCTGATDSTAGIATALTAATGRTLFIKSGCRLGLASPGAGNAAINVPANTTIYCEDPSAGFSLLKQRCTGGVYPGAACDTDAECTPAGGGTAGTCDNDFGTASTNPCSVSTCFAPTGGSTYTVFKDQAPNLAGNFSMHNCTIYVGQADGYQRVVGGSGAGDPCRGECTGGLIPGSRCDVDGDCIGGACSREEDFPGGTCTGAPKSASAAATAKINIFDFANTIVTNFVNVKVKDHLSGDFTWKTNNQLQMFDCNGAAELTDCRSPLSTPADSLCYAGSSVPCCYGAANNPVAANKNNTQPTAAVAQGVIAGTASSILRSAARGTTNAFNVSNGSVIDASAAWPTTSAGPGTGGAGFIVGTDSVVSKSTALTMTGGTCITLDAGSSALEDKCNGTMTTGITAANGAVHIAGNVITGATSDGVFLGRATTNSRVTDNIITSSPVDTMDNGINVNGAANARISNNHVARPEIYAFNMSAAAARGNSLVDNTTNLSSARPTPALHPIHVGLIGGLGGQISIEANYFVGGWRGIDIPGTRADGLINTSITGNRFVGLWGAPINAGGAGVNVQSNYVNADNTSGTTVCDASCGGGSPPTRGTLCTQDSDCTANGNTCPSTFDCIPEPLSAYIGTPNSTVAGASHPMFLGNLFFNGLEGGGAIKQCDVAGLVGQQCTVAAANGTCAGGATCSGGPPRTCQSGADEGKLCCQTSAGATCAVRTATPFVRAVDPGTAATYQDMVFNGNLMFGGSSKHVGIDMVSSESLGNITFTRSNIVGNLFDGVGTGILFPTTGTFSDLNINGNDFAANTADVTNYKGTYGELSFVPCTVALAADQTAASTSFVDITALKCSVLANRSYNVRCDIIYTTAAGSTGMGFALAAPASPTVFTYTTRMCVAAGCGSAGTDVFTEQVASTNDGTFATALTDTAAGNNFARIEGILATGANAGNVVARMHGDAAANYTIRTGSSCIVYQTPAGS